MEAILVDKFLDFALGGLASLVALVWFMLRLYIKDQIHDLRDYLQEEFEKLNEIFESKEVAAIKFDRHADRISALERKANGRVP